MDTAAYFFFFVVHYSRVMCVCGKCKKEVTVFNEVKLGVFDSTCSGSQQLCLCYCTGFA